MIIIRIIIYINIIYKVNYVKEYEVRRPSDCRVLEEVPTIYINIIYKVNYVKEYEVRRPSDCRVFSITNKL